MRRITTADEGSTSVATVDEGGTRKEQKRLRIAKAAPIVLCHVAALACTSIVDEKGGLSKSDSQDSETLSNDDPAAAMVILDLERGSTELAPSDYWDWGSRAFGWDPKGMPQGASLLDIKRLIYAKWPYPFVYISGISHPLNGDTD